ncbi:hypothetical protein Hanom_Chr05g00461711 [Helianthus anomalus]
MDGSNEPDENGKISNLLDPNAKKQTFGRLAKPQGRKWRPNTFIETLRERMFKPTLSTIIPENSKIVTVSPFDTVVMATKKMLEFRSSSAIVTVDNKPRGILT